MEKIEIDNKKLLGTMIRVADMWATQSPDELGYLNGLIELAQIALEEQGLQCNTQTGEIVNIEPELNNWYVCECSCMQGRFIEGRVYREKHPAKLIDEFGEESGIGLISQYFRPATEAELSLQEVINREKLTELERPLNNDFAYKEGYDTGFEDGYGKCVEIACTILRNIFVLYDQKDGWLMCKYSDPEKLCEDFKGILKKLKGNGDDRQQKDVGLLDGAVCIQ